MSVFGWFSGIMDDVAEEAARTARETAVATLDQMKEDGTLKRLINEEITRTALRMAEDPKYSYARAKLLAIAQSE